MRERFEVVRQKFDQIGHRLAHLVGFGSAAGERGLGAKQLSKNWARISQKLKTIKLAKRCAEINLKNASTMHSTFERNNSMLKMVVELKKPFTQMNILEIN